MTARGPQMDADRLMALLYGELDAGEAERARAAVAESPEQAAELEGFERVRSLFRDLPDEEPPARLSAQLLAEAARSAPTPRKAVVATAEGGFWARLVSWLSPVQHPGFAAAASLLLVAGVAGVLYLRKGEDMSKAGKAPAPAAEPASSATAAVEAAPPPPAPADQPVAAGEPDGEAIEEWAEGALGAADEKKASKGGKAPARASKDRAGDLALDDRGLAKKKREAKPSAPAKKPDTLRGGTVYGLSEQEMMPGAPSGGAAPSNQAMPAEPAPSPAPPQSSAPATKARPPTAAELHSRAVELAQAKRCSDVRAVGEEIKAINPEYYKKFRADSRLKACLEAPTQYPARK